MSLSPLFFRPRPLRAGVLYAAPAPGTGFVQLNATGIAQKQIINPSPSAQFQSYAEWGGDQWSVPLPGIYEIEVVGGGGGGSGGEPTGAPGFERRGFGGKRGGYQLTLATLVASASIRSALNAPGGAQAASGSPGSASSLNMPSVPAAPGGAQGVWVAGGSSGTQWQGEPGLPSELVPALTGVGAGGNGYTSGSNFQGQAGLPGLVALRLVG